MFGREKMTISEIMEKMIRFSDGSLHDISHLIAVWTYAKTIGELEHLEPETQFILEVAAITHDIACPAIRDESGRTDHKLQETMGAPMAREFLADTGLTAEQIERIAWLVGHHHTLNAIDGPDYQILIEADLIVNACEKGWGGEKMKHLQNTVMKTAAGKRIAGAVFGI